MDTKDSSNLKRKCNEISPEMESFNIASISPAQHFLLGSVYSSSHELIQWTAKSNTRREKIINLNIHFSYPALPKKHGRNSKVLPFIQFFASSTISTISTISF